MQQKKCPNCQAEIPDSAVFCPSCGHTLPQATNQDSIESSQPASLPQSNKCPRCGHSHSHPLPDYCQMCGYPLGNSSPIPSDIRSPRNVISQTESKDRESSPSLPKARSSIKRKFLNPINKTKALPRWVSITGILILLSSAIIVVGLYLRNKFPVNTTGAVLESCKPSQADENFELANQRDLQGELIRDSYFKGNQEYTISRDSVFVVPKGRTLIIEPGVRVKFGQGAKMVVRGTLIACGRNSRRILFTADSTVGTPGFWKGIEFENAEPTSVLGHVSFEFGGRDFHSPLWIENTDLHIEDVKFESNQWFSLSLNPDSTPQIREPFIVNNGPQGWEIRGGKLSKNQNWNSEQPYIVNGIIEITDNASLTILPDTWIKFQTRSAIDIIGRLDAEGTSGKPIRFTSVNEGAEEGNPDPRPGDWIGIRIAGRKSEAKLNFVEIRYGGADANTRGCLWLAESNPNLTNITISECEGFAMSMDISSTPKIEKLTLTESDPLRRLELRKSNLEGTASQNLKKISASDQTPLIPVATGLITVKKDAKLIIDPGTVLLFYGGGQSGIWVDGTLQAGEKDKDPIVFTSWRDPEFNRTENAQSGDWGGIVINNGPTSQLINVFIRYAGVAGSKVGCLNIKESKPILSSLNIEKCNYYPLVSDLASDPIVEEITLKDNLPANEWAIRESVLSVGNKRSWKGLHQSKSNEAIIRIVIGNLTVDQGAELDIDEGIVIKFSEGVGLKNRGVLRIVGESQSPVILTSWRDPEFSNEAGIQAGDWLGLSLEGRDSITQLSQIEIRYAGNRGRGAIYLAESSPDINDVAIIDASGYPITMDANANPQVDRLRFVNAYPTVEVRGGELSNIGEQVWDPWTDSENRQIIRVITGRLVVNSDSVLHLATSMTVKFTNNAELDVFGSLIADGVAFTSYHDDESGGDSDGNMNGELSWQGIKVHGRGISRLENGSIRYAKTGVWMENTNLIISNFHIDDSWESALNMDNVSSPEIADLYLDQNEINGVLMRNNTFPDGTTQWKILGSPQQQIVRVVPSTLSIQPNAEMVVDPGVIIKFAPQAGLVVGGSLQAGQENESPVVFTSLSDDSQGGDTDGGQGEANRGSWKGIVVNPDNSGAQLSLVVVEIRYAENGLTLTNLPNWEVMNLTISDSLFFGLSCDSLSVYPLPPSITSLVNNGMETLSCPTPDREE